MKLVEELRTVVARLRDPEAGCPWDRAQTFASVAPYILEEAHEVAETIDQNNFPALCDELGDLLFLLMFILHIAEEQRVFNFEMVITGAMDKIIRRHPHVFSDTPGGDNKELVRRWEQQKSLERAARGEPTNSLMDGISHGLPGIARAIKIQKRAATVGFDWQDSNGVLEKLIEEIAELRSAQQMEHNLARIGEEIGDILFTGINLARHCQIDPETALRQANTRFEQRFRKMEELSQNKGETISKLNMEQLEQLWQEAKIRRVNP